ncbi:MAG: DUF4349 domain-containing protein [Phycisphaerales bacterium]|nr:DUF4349 domain-containing protein [Phycisphaerales bacterium]
MNEMQNSIERELRAMSDWEGETPELWRRALAAQTTPTPEPPARLRSRSGILTWPWGRGQLFVAAAGLAAVLLLCVALVPAFGTSRLDRDMDLRGGATAGSELPNVTARLGELSPTLAMSKAIADQSLSADKSAKSLGDWEIADAARGRAGAGDQSRFKTGEVTADRAEPEQAAAAAERAVVRKATIELTTPDVRAAALRARQILSEPRGEYVESADIDESDADHPRADLVLRVEASRLEGVVSQLRELGEVGAEHLDGEDVTDQMVDLGARLDNERRVEKELAELLEKRPDDTLEDILKVRRELGSVRERIERLAAQQDNLARMVRLARVAVMLRTEAKAPEPEPQQGVWDGFLKSLGLAWTDGLAALLGTIAGFVRVLVGGAIWFALAGLAMVAAWRRWRADHPRRLADA